MIDTIIPIVLKYEEPGVTDATVKSLIDAGFSSDQIVYADRDGVGNMSRAFNQAIIKTRGAFEFRMTDLSAQASAKFIWFLTNVTFSPEVPELLAETFDSDTAAVHPAFDSEHYHMRRRGGIFEDVPFVEWTAPMVSVSAWFDVGCLDTSMPYWGMDLDWSHRAKEKGYDLIVNGKCEVNHTYLNHNYEQHPISRIRKELREYWDEPTERRMIEKYGEDWLREIWPSHYYVTQGKKRIYVKD